MPLFDIKLLQGRNFTAQEVSSQALVVIINETLARQLQPDGKVIGQKLYSRDGNTSYEIIGVSSDHHLPDQWSAVETGRSYLTRNCGSICQSTNSAQTRHAVEQNRYQCCHDPSLAALSRCQYLQHRLQREPVLFNNYLAAAVTSTLVVLSFVLAAIGIYGVLSYSVQLRRFELGVRMAIGARPATILRQLLGENLKPVLAGLALAAVGLAALWFGLQKTTR